MNQPSLQSWAGNLCFRQRHRRRDFDWGGLQWHVCAVIGHNKLKFDVQTHIPTPRQWGVDFEWGGGEVREAQTFGMQEQAAQAGDAGMAIELRVAVYAPPPMMQRDFRHFPPPYRM